MRTLWADGIKLMSELQTHSLSTTWLRWLISKRARSPDLHFQLSRKFCLLEHTKAYDVHSRVMNNIKAHQTVLANSSVVSDCALNRSILFSSDLTFPILMEGRYSSSPKLPSLYFLRCSPGFCPCLAAFFPQTIVPLQYALFVFPLCISLWFATSCLSEISWSRV